MIRPPHTHFISLSNVFLGLRLSGKLVSSRKAPRGWIGSSGCHGLSRSKTRKTHCRPQEWQRRHATKALKCRPQQVVSTNKCYHISLYAANTDGPSLTLLATHTYFSQPAREPKTTQHECYCYEGSLFVSILTSFHCN